MRVEVLLTPREVSADALKDRAVAVFDVLRATTTITAALAAGVGEIRIFESIEAAQSAAQTNRSSIILAGEHKCLAPQGFDLGNSPGAFNANDHAGRTVYMATTNGTRAIVAARSARYIFAGALVNASALADRLAQTGLDLALICAGTDGQPAMEDLLGAGGVINALTKRRNIRFDGDIPKIALRLFRMCNSDLGSELAQTTGGQNIQAAGLGSADIDFAARLDSIAVVGQIFDHPLRATRA